MTGDQYDCRQQYTRRSLLTRGLISGKRYLVCLTNVTTAEHGVSSSVAPLRIMRNRDCGVATRVRRKVSSRKRTVLRHDCGWRRGLVPLLDNNSQKVCNQGAFFHKEGCFVTKEIPLDSDICAEMFPGMDPSHGVAHGALVG